MPMNPRLLRPLARLQAPPPAGTPASLLLHFDGNFTDSSANNLTATPTEIADTSTESKFGNGSAYFPEHAYPITGQSVVVSDENDALGLGTESFTIEWWFRSSATNSYACMLSRFYEQPGGIAFFLNGSFADGAPEVYWNEFSNSLFFKSSIGMLNDDEWHHFAFVRNQETCAMYIDGVQAATRANVFVNSAAADFVIGSDAEFFALGRDFFGYIDDLRIVKGLAVYGGDFVPPAAALSVSATPYTNYKPYGTFLFSECDGSDLVGTYADGTGGRYTEVISVGSCE